MATEKVGMSEGELFRRKADGTSGFVKEYALPALVFRITGGAPTPVDPGANTVGGYQLDNVVMELSFQTHMDTEWDGASDISIELIFEVNVDNSGGNVGDTVDFVVDCFMKGDGEVATRNQTLISPMVVGQSPQFKQFKAEFDLIFDDVGDPVNPEDTLGIVINLDTVASEVDNIILNYVEFKYQTTTPALLR